jgi:hypothetical protein
MEDLLHSCRGEAWPTSCTTVRRAGARGEETSRLELQPRPIGLPPGVAFLFLGLAVLAHGVAVSQPTRIAQPTFHDGIMVECAHHVRNAYTINTTRCQGRVRWSSVSATPPLWACVHEQRKDENAPSV